MSSNMKNTNSKNNSSNGKGHKSSSHMDESKTSMEQKSTEEGYEGYIAKAGEIYHQVAAHVDGMLGYEEDAKYHASLLEEGKAGEDAKEKFQQGKEKVVELVDQAKEKIQGTQEKIMGKVEETREKAKGKMEEAKGKMEETKGKMKGKAQQIKKSHSKDENMFEGLSDDEEQEVEGGHFGAGRKQKQQGGSISASSLAKSSGIPQSQLNVAPSDDHIDKETKNFHELGKRDEKHKLSNILHKSRPDEQLPENQRNNIGENDENKRYNTGNYVTEPVDYTTGKMKGLGEKHHHDILKGHNSHQDKWSHVASVGETDFDSDHHDKSKSKASFMNKKNKHQKRGVLQDATNKV